MARFVLVLLFALSLWPAQATASPGVPASERDRLVSADVWYGNELVRSSGGLELLQRLGSAGGGGSGEQRSPETDPPGRPGLGRPADAPLLHRTAAGAVDRIVPPHCERLPYYATAPPSSR